VALVINAFLSFTLIPSFGIYGALIATLSAWAVSTIPRMIAVGSLLNHTLYLSPFIKIWINALMMAGTVYFSGNLFRSGYLSLLIPIITGIVFYFTLSFFNKPFSSDTRFLIISVVKDSHPFITRLVEILC
jgi:O-antigen/teichoic acid export membrane protein